MQLIRQPFRKMANTEVRYLLLGFTPAHSVEKAGQFSTPELAGVFFCGDSGRVMVVNRHWCFALPERAAKMEPAH